jgi:polysaccharide biosynthesis protein PelE
MMPPSFNQVSAATVNSLTTEYVRPSRQVDRHTWQKPSAHKTYSESLLLPVFVGILITGIEIFIAFSLLKGSIPVEVAGIIHLLLVGGIFVGLREISPNRQNSYDFSLLVLCTAFLGPMGSAGITLGTLTRFAFKHASMPDQKLDSKFFLNNTDESTIATLEIVQPDIGMVWAGDTLASFSDVMFNGSIESKQAVIYLIMVNFKPHFSPALITALNDIEPAVRVQAATAMARIESQFLELSISLNEQYRQDPTNNFALLTLAKHLDAYAHTGLLDIERERVMRAEALNLFRRYNDKVETGNTVDHQMIRLMVRLGLYEEAVSVTEKILLVGGMSACTLSWSAEAFFVLGRYDQLQVFCRKHHLAARSDDLLNNPQYQSFALWSGKQTKL